MMLLVICSSDLFKQYDFNFQQSISSFAHPKTTFYSKKCLWPHLNVYALLKAARL